MVKKENKQKERSNLDMDILFIAIIALNLYDSGGGSLLPQ